MKPLPPLRALQIFAAVGRCGSIVAAAGELGISAGAVSQQIRLLEDWLGLHLVERSGRGIVLTRWGRLYLPKVSEAFTRLEDAQRLLERERRGGEITVSTLPSLASKWLGPLLFAWQAQHPDVPIRLHGADAEPRLDEGQVDFRVTYGAAARQHRHAIVLFTDELLPVCRPELAVPTPAAILDLPLIGIDWAPDFHSPPGWADWLQLAGLGGRVPRPALTFTLSAQAIDAAIAGRGLVLAQRSMVAEDLRLGRLRQPFALCLPMPEPYWLAWGASTLDHARAELFHRWLVARGREVAGHGPATLPAHGS